MSDIGVLIFNNSYNEVVFILFRWVVRVGMVRASANLSSGGSVVLLNHVGVDTFTIFFVINPELSLSKET